MAEGMEEGVEDGVEDGVEEGMDMVREKRGCRFTGKMHSHLDGLGGSNWIRLN